MSEEITVNIIQQSVTAEISQPSISVELTGNLFSATPIGDDKQVQFNNNGIFGGFGSYDKVSDELTLNILKLTGEITEDSQAITKVYLNTVLDNLPVLGITDEEIANWNIAYGWGDHEGLYDLLGEADSVLSAHNLTYNHSLIATALQGETDPVFSQWLIDTPPLYSFTEEDPIFTNWLATTPPLYSETDPIFTAWNKSDGISITENQISDLRDYILTSEKAANSGVATLDSGGKIPAGQLPSTVMDFKGNWNASTNTPTIADGTGNAGDVYLCNVAGTIDLGGGDITFSAGDWVVYNGTIWEQSINSNQVVSVNTQTGAVVLDADDISDTLTTNKYVTAGDITKLGNLSGTNTGDQDLTAYQLKPVEGAFIDGDKTKLDEIEALADVTDTANVTTAGALMDSEVTNLAQVKAFDTTDYAPSLGADDNYVTDAEKIVIGNTSGINSGDQDIPVSGTDFDPVGTDNSTNVTLVGTGTYLSLTGQAITVDPITESDITDFGTYSTDIHSNITALNAVSNINTGDETTASVKSLLGITTLSGSNTGDQDLSGKQDTLVNTTNIKSVNGTTLLGSGNLEVGGAVDSVNTQTGAVVLDADDIDDTSTTNKWTSLAEKAIWNGKQDALGFTPENISNKENTIIDNSTTKYPTVNLLKTGLDAKQNTGLDWLLDGNTLGAKKTLGSIDNQDIGIITNNLERLTVLKGGNVGIGTTNPSQKLDVAGNININTNGTGMLISSYQGANSVGYNSFIGGGGQNSIGEVGATYKGSSNTVQGYTALQNNTTGYQNSAQGAYALRYNTTGNYNTVNGYASLYNNTTGVQNTANGMYSLYNNTTGGYNTVNGYASLYNNTTGVHNTANGVYSLFSNTTGSNNFGLGHQAGRYIADGTTPNETGSYNTFIGAKTKALADGDTNEMVIGNGAIGVGSNSVVFGNDDITKTVLKGNVGIGTTNPSEKLDVNGNIKATQFKLSDLNTAPASSSDTGTKGEIRVTADAIYICSATDTWVKTDLATF